jgi:hypothetical protein
MRGSGIDKTRRQQLRTIIARRRGTKNVFDCAGLKSANAAVTSEFRVRKIGRRFRISKPIRSFATAPGTIKAALAARLESSSSLFGIAPLLLAAAFT